MITYDETLADLRKIAADKMAENGGDYVYQRPVDLPSGADGLRCAYVHGSVERPKAGCIVGALLSKRGVPFERLMELEVGEDETAIGALFQWLTPYVEFEPKAEALLRDVQHRQDRFVPWSWAVEDAAVAVAASIVGGVE